MRNLRIPLTKREIIKLKLGLADELENAMGLRPGWFETILSEFTSGEVKRRKNFFFYCTWFDNPENVSGKQNYVGSSIQKEIV